MERTEYYQALDRLLTTPELQEMYKHDAAFHAGIEVMIRGGDPVDILFQICKGAAQISEAYRKHIEICPMPIKKSSYNGINA